jgi:S1-C subfamily serine protease
MGVQVEALGLTVHQLDPEVAQQLGFPKSTTGLLVLKVDPKGPTAGQIQIYDLIEEVARTPVSSVEDLQQLVTDSGSETCLLKVQRNTESRLESHLVLVPR